MTRKFSTKPMGRQSKSALADDGKRTVTFTAKLFYDQFVTFLWMRVADNQKVEDDDALSVLFKTAPNAQVRKRARDLKGVWS